MDLLKYRLMCRYEYLSNNGKQFTNWFHVVGSPYVDNENELNDKLNETLKIGEQYVKILKLKREYKIEQFDINSLPVVHNNIKKSDRKPGRPKKTTK